MKTVQDFFEKYDLERFYAGQVRKSATPVRPFKADEHKKLSYGLIPGYRRYDLFYERYYSAARIILATGLIQDGARILDIGSGEGFFKFFFDGMTSSQIEWHGIEIWKERAEFCSHVGYRMFDLDLDKDRLPFKDAAYEVVLASHVIEHLARPGDAVREMARVLKPGGILLVATPTKPPLVSGLVAAVRSLGHKGTGQTQQAFDAWSLLRFVLNSTGWPRKALLDMRGFRLVSSRKKLPLEDWDWFYKCSTALGRWLLALVPEVNILLRKP